MLTDGIGPYLMVRPTRKMVDGVDSIVFDTGERIMVREVERVLKEDLDELEFKDHGRTHRVIPLTMKTYKRHIESVLMDKPDEKFRSDEELVDYVLAASPQEVLL